ncbi:MAG: hypothetical protein JNL28_15945 [Planctomycetes bacterium]|nr:hypothetical protein [Planctomycetota bacterium]
MIELPTRALMFAGVLCALEVAPPREEPRSKETPPVARPAPREEQHPVAQGAHLALHDERARAALVRGIDWLAAAQNADGSLPATGLKTRAGASPATNDGAGSFAPVAVTALSTLALLASGSEPERGPHGRETARAVDWLVARANLDAQSERRGYIALDGDALSRMHGHGYAALALAQAFAMSPKTERGARIEAALTAAITCIQGSQSVDGGWWYEPKSGLQHENSITICAVQALRAAHGAGLKVDAQTIERAIDYVSRTQKPDGSFRYGLGDPKSSVALTAAAIATLNASGKYGGKVIDDGYDWIFRRLAARSARELGSVDVDDFIICPFYERVCLGQALWQHPDNRVFDDWWNTEIAGLLVTQKRDGSWEDPRYGDVYATAMNCLLLALPEGLLPIFQR